MDIPEFAQKVLGWLEEEHARAESDERVSMAADVRASTRARKFITNRLREKVDKLLVELGYNKGRYEDE